MFRCKNSPSQSGYSLAELLVILALTGVLGLVIAGLWSISSQSTRLLSNSLQMNDTINDLRAALSRTADCTNNFRNIALGDDPRGTSVSRVTEYGGSRPTQVLAEVGVQRGNTKIESMRLRPISRLNPGMIAAELEVTFAKRNPEDPAAAPRAIGILAHVQGGRIQNCWVREDASSKTLSQICFGLTGGALDTYDTATNSCTLLNGRWFEGSNTAATCPAGTILPLDAQAEYNCEMIVPADFEDKQTTFTNTAGQTVNRAYEAFFQTLDKPRRTCNCVYATDVPASVVAQVKCKILCQVP